MQRLQGSAHETDQVDIPFLGYICDPRPDLRGVPNISKPANEQADGRTPDAWSGLSPFAHFTIVSYLSHTIYPKIKEELHFECVRRSRTHSKCELLLNSRIGT